MIERTYQKEADLVRKEWKVSTPMSLNKFEEAVSKGLTGMEKAQDIKDLKTEVRGVWEALKYNNSRMLELGRFVEAVSKSQISMVERITDLEKGLNVLSNSVSKLVEVLAENPTNDKSKVSGHVGDVDGFEYVR
jgi:prophage DNA circulation protein